jgi:Domain of unknown function (DUF4158)
MGGILLFSLPDVVLLQLGHKLSSMTLCERIIAMKRQWTDEELIRHFTLSAKELDLIGESKTDHNLLGFAVLLKYFQYEGCFPSQKHDIPSIVIAHLAQQLGTVPEKIIPYD